MSIQEERFHYDKPGQTKSSSTKKNLGDAKYDPFDTDEDDDNQHENEQSTDINHQKQESIRINNGSTIHPVINNMNTSSSSDNSPSLPSNEQQQQPRRKSPVEQQHSKHSDRRSKSPNSSDRKRLRHSSPDSSITNTTVNNNDSSNKEIISSSKYRKSYQDDNNGKKSKHYRSSSKSPLSSNNNNKKSSDLKDEKSSNSTDSRHSSKKDDYHSHRSNSSRSYHSSSKYSSRDYSSHNDRRTTNSNLSSPSRIPSTIIPSDGNLSLHNNESNNNHETTTEDRNRIYNRLKGVSDNNTPSNLLINNSNKSTSPSGSAFTNSNGGSQRSRSNLIQIVTTEATSVSTQVPTVPLSSSQIKSESIKPTSVPTNDSSKSVTIPKANGGTADDMLMEEMLLEEEQEKVPVKSIDLDSVTIPETLTQKIDKKDEPIKVIPTTSIATTTVTTATTTTNTSTTSTSSMTPSPIKKPYTLYKVAHTNHTTPPLSSRHKKQAKKDSSITQPDSTTNKPLANDTTRQTSLDERISSLLGAPPTLSTKTSNLSIEHELDTRPNSLVQITTTSTPSDKSTESPQDVKSLISTTIKKDRDHSSLTEKLHTNEERRSTTSKHYTTEWVATQKPEEAPPTEELNALPPLVTLPTLVSSQPSINNSKASISNTGETTMLGKLNEAMSKLIHTTIPPTNEAEDAVPVSAKHLERLERRKQREKRQSEIAAIAKEALKPAFKKRAITKDEYKEIMKKVVTKTTHANEVDRARIRKMIDAYVEKYRTLRQHNTSKTSTISNVNGT